MPNAVSGDWDAHGGLRETGMTGPNTTPKSEPWAQGEEGAWDRGNVGTPFLVKRPEGSGSPGTRKNPGWYLYYVGTSTDEATGKTSYAIGCAEQVDPRMGLAGPWRRVPATC